ncbi:MAG: NAD-dependent epimerase/dehydratase family protein [Gemmatimonadetes bacterium]|nr:NAD-dependent epimerase/dehydratase family protein [Gemmatimonadota bacterium]NNF37311.1 NAD-dependent epimerase/dehydratase family protein [Gemmatimonadota bacterium]NNK63408.1 NAD-dependent epimerase/dehydratase family protein [Gemmatimonadota bacterium]
MSEPQRVVVTGGAGFIGSHVVDAYLARGHQVWVIDDLSSGRRENLDADAELLVADVGSPEAADLLRQVRPDVVNHHAAQIDVRVSVDDPGRDARTNILGLLNLTEAAREVGTRRFVFVSSGGVVYGEPEVRPTPETMPKLPLSPYGVTKLAGEYYLNYYRRVHGMEYVALRYSNVFGPRQDPHGEAGVVAIFCNRLLAGEALTIFGDGEQTRDYVFVKDVAAANMLATDMALPAVDGDGADLDDVAFNVGTGLATSVNRLADSLEQVAGLHPGRDYRAGRPGELRHSTLDAGKLRGRGWAPQATLTEALQQTYEYIAQNRTGAT